MAIFGMSMAGILLLVSLNLKDPLTVVFVIGMASFFNDLVMPPPGALAWTSAANSPAPSAAA